MHYEKEVPMRLETDVLVVGGGPAGVSAAIACAAQGKTVFLAENNGCFGGSGTTGLVPSFAQFTDGKVGLTGRFGHEIHNRLYGRDYDFKRGFHAFSVEKLKRLYDELVVDAGVKFSFFTRLVDVAAHDGHVDYALFAAKSGLFAIKAKIYIDTTGDGDLCAFAGGQFAYGDVDGIAMPATLCSLWANIRSNGFDCNQQDGGELAQAIRDGVFTKEDYHLPGIQRTDRDRGVGGGNVGHCYAVDATDERSLTAAMVEGRKTLLEYERFYREYLNGFEDTVLCYSADMLGIRESRRIYGDYVLCGQDFLNRAVFPDEIGRYAYPIDIHCSKPGGEAFAAFKTEYFGSHYAVGESYGIPYRILTPARLSNVLTAGRCVSTDRQMQASIRVMPGCFITGQAAGIAAALACPSGDIRRVEIPALQKAIVEYGGYLPNRM